MGLIERERIIIESEQTPGLRSLSSSKPDNSYRAFQGVKEIVTLTANEFTNSIKNIDVMPSSVELEFGITINSVAGAIIAKRSDEATFRVKITWDRDLNDR